MGVKVGTFNQKTSTGEQIITGLGFQPQVILFFYSGATASGSFSAGYNGGFGLATAADVGSVCASAQDAVATHNTSGRAAQKAITIIEHGEVLKAEADMTSLDTDGFTLNWSTADAVGRIINYIAISGFTSVKLLEWQIQATTGNQGITGAGFTPTTVINIWEHNDAGSATPYIQAHGGVGIGIMDATTGWALGTFDKDAASLIDVSQSNAAGISNSDINGVQKNVDPVSLDADGFTVNINSASNTTSKVYSLCLAGGPAIKFGSVAKTSNQLRRAEVSGLGFRPGAVLIAAGSAPTAEAVDTDITFSIGASDGDTEANSGWVSDEAATSNTAKINKTDSLWHEDITANQTLETTATFSSFDVDGFSFSYGSVSSSATLDFWHYIAIESQPGTGSALKIFTGTFDKKTSTGEQIITGVGFTPKVLLCWYGGSTADNTWADFLRRGFGAATSPTNRYAVGDAAEEDHASSNCAATKSPAHVISIVDPDQVLEGEADLTSFDSDGFTLDWIVANATAYKIYFICLGGDDEIEDAKIVSFVTQSGTGDQSVTGAGFRPTSIITFGNSEVNNAENVQYGHGGLQISITDGINDAGQGSFLFDGSGGRAHMGVFKATATAGGFIEGSVNSIFQFRTNFTSFDSDGFTFDIINQRDSVGYRIFALCLKGVHTTVGTFNGELSTTGDKAYTGVGFQPIGLFTVGSIVSSDDQIFADLHFKIGAADGTNENAMFSGADAGTPDLGNISKVGSIVIHDRTSLATLTTEEEGTFVSFDSDGFTINWIISDIQRIRNNYMAFARVMTEAGGPGDPVAATAQSIMSLVSTSSQDSIFPRSVTSVLNLIQQVRQSFILKSASSALNLTQLAQATISFADVFTPSVESILNLTDSAKARHNFNVSATNILALNQQVTNDSIKEHSAANTLAFVQTLAENFVLASAANTLALTGSAGAGKNIPQSASSVMVLAQTLAENFKLQSAASSIAFTQFVVATINTAKVISVSNNMALSQTLSLARVFNRSIPFNAADFQAEIQFTQSAVVARNIRVQAANTLGLVSDVQLKEHNEAVTSFLSFAQKMGRVVTASAANSMFLQQEAARIFKLTSQLNLISTATPVTGRDAVSIIPFVSTATVLSDFARIVTQNLGIRQAVSFHIDNSAPPNVECTYSPFVGTVTSGITPPPTTPPTLGTATLTLTHPFVDPTTTLILRNPELNNAERFQFARINRTTRGGDLKIFSDPTWPKQETLKVQIEALTSAQKDSLVSFFEDNIGLEIGLLDDENRQWKGIITQPDADITDVSGNDCTYSVIFEFEGELQ